MSPSDFNRVATLHRDIESLGRKAQHGCHFKRLTAL